jgi:hypothetical protein
LRDKDFEITNVIIRSNLCCVLSVSKTRQSDRGGERREREGKRGERLEKEEREEIGRKGRERRMGGGGRR